MSEAEQIYPNYVGKLGPRATGLYTIGLERMADIVDEVRQMHEDHWDEVEGWNEYPFDPDYFRMMEMEHHYQFLLFTVRDNELNLVGNMACTLAYSLTSKSTLVANEIAFYLKPDHRKGLLAGGLLTYAEDTLRRIHVNSMCISDKAVAGAGGTSIAPLARRFGFKPVMTGFEKSLGD